MPDILSDAKATLAHASSAFPSSVAPKASAAPVKAPATAPTLGQELAEKAKMVRNANMALTDAPKMHKGGTIKADGNYNLKAGEHVLTAPEAAKARNHALMANGMKSLVQPAPKKYTSSMTVEAAPKTTATDKTLASPKKPGMPSMTISPSPKAVPGMSAQSAITHPGDTTRPTASDLSKT